jgi:peroxiredoxin Q/BCP
MATKKTTTGNGKTEGSKKGAAAAKPKAASEVKAKVTAQPKPKAVEAAALAVGAKAPDFKLPTDDGRTVSLADFAGKNVVLYFYPKDNTPGCTREACSFQENLGALEERGAVVLGVSRDSPKTHAGFKTKYGLAFPLLADQDGSVHKAYGAWGKKVMYGKEMIGAIRSTVLIDKTGRIAKVYPSVKVDGHAADVLAALDGLPG